MRFQISGGKPSTLPLLQMRSMRFTMGLLVQQIRGNGESIITKQLQTSSRCLNRPLNIRNIQESPIWWERSQGLTLIIKSSAARPKNGRTDLESNRYVPIRF